MERLADSLAGRSGSSDSDDIAGVAVSASYGSRCGSSAVGGGCTGTSGGASGRAVLSVASSYSYDTGRSWPVSDNTL